MLSSFYPQVDAFTSTSGIPATETAKSDFQRKKEENPYVHCSSLHQNSKNCYKRLKEEAKKPCLLR